MSDSKTAALHFVMLPPNFAPESGFPESRAIIAVIRKAFGGATPVRVVCLSTIGAQQGSGIGLLTALHILEEEIGSLPIPSAFMRAGWFMESAVWDIPSAREEGRIFSFLQPLDKPFFLLIATANVGGVAAETMLQTWSGRRL
jgi:NAD(P)H dehydrogenase (quinone)